MSTWRPANIKNLPPVAAHVINQLFRETNQRIDDLTKRTTLHQRLKSTATLTFGSVPANGSVERVINAIGVGSNHAVHVSPKVPPGSNLVWSSYVKQSGQIVVRLSNPTTSPISTNNVAWNWVATI